MEHQHLALSKCSILSLPPEILQEILGNMLPLGFRSDQPVPREVFYMGSEDRRSLSSFRSTCRQFNDFVTPYLFRKLSVSLRADSVRRFEALLDGNPHIRSGLRGVEINLRFHSRLLAADIKSFHRSQASPLLSLAIYDAEIIAEPDYVTVGHDEEEADVYAYRDALMQLRAINRNWKKFVKSARSPTDDAAEDIQMGHWHDLDGDEDYDKHTKILVDGFNAYAAQQVEEYRFIQDQSFARRIAAALSGHTEPVSIWFNDRKIAEAPDDLYTLRLAKTPDLLQARICITRKWRKLEDLQGSDAEDDLLMPARLLADIPIACHEAGVKIRTLQIQCFPLKVGFTSLVPSHARTESSEQQIDPWAQLASACRELTNFKFAAGNFSPCRDQHLSEPDSAIINGYISAVSSSRLLQSANMNFCTYEVRSRRTDDWYLAAPILASLVSKDLRQLTIMFVEVDAATLQSVLLRLDLSQLELLYLCDIKLTQGFWLDVIKELRTALRSRPHRTSTFRVLLDKLYDSTMPFNCGASLQLSNDDFNDRPGSLQHLQNLSASGLDRGCRRKWRKAYACCIVKKSRPGRRTSF